MSTQMLMDPNPLLRGDRVSHQSRSVLRGRSVCEWSVWVGLTIPVPQMRTKLGSDTAFRVWQPRATTGHPKNRSTCRPRSPGSHPDPVKGLERTFKRLFGWCSHGKRHKMARDGKSNNRMTFMAGKVCVFRLLSCGFFNSPESCGCESKPFSPNPVRLTSPIEEAVQLTRCPPGFFQF